MSRGRVEIDAETEIVDRLSQLLQNATQLRNVLSYTDMNTFNLIRGITAIKHGTGNKTVTGREDPFVASDVSDVITLVFGSDSSIACACAEMIALVSSGQDFICQYGRKQLELRIVCIISMESDDKSATASATINLLCDYIKKMNPSLSIKGSVLVVPTPASLLSRTATQAFQLDFLDIISFRKVTGESGRCVVVSCWSSRCDIPLPSDDICMMDLVVSCCNKVKCVHLLCLTYVDSGRILVSDGLTELSSECLIDHRRETQSIGMSFSLPSMNIYSGTIVLIAFQFIMSSSTDNNSHRRHILDMCPCAIDFDCLSLLLSASSLPVPMSNACFPYLQRRLHALERERLRIINLLSNNNTKDAIHNIEGNSSSHSGSGSSCESDAVYAARKEVRLAQDAQVIAENMMISMLMTKTNMQINNNNNNSDNNNNNNNDNDNTVSPAQGVTLLSSIADIENAMINFDIKSRKNRDECIMLMNETYEKVVSSDDVDDIIGIFTRKLRESEELRAKTLEQNLLLSTRAEMLESQLTKALIVMNNLLLRSETNNFYNTSESSRNASNSNSAGTGVMAATDEALIRDTVHMTGGYDRITVQDEETPW